MTVFDYVFLGVVGVSLLIGAWRGLASELLALAAWVIAFVAAREASPYIAPYLQGLTAEPMLVSIAAFALVFVATLLVLGVARLLLREMLRAAGLGLADRTLGAVFGFVRGMLVAFVCVLVAGLTELPRQVWWREAMFAPPMETAVLACRRWMPEALAARINY